MMGTIENPTITIEDLNQLEEKIKGNLAQPEDYAKLNDYMTFLGFNNYILDKLKEKRINNFSELIYLRKHKKSDTDLNLAVGGIYGVISVLKKYIEGKL